MRHFRKLGLTVLTLLVLIFIIVPAATAAYQLGGFSVQYRVYEDGSKFNRYYFEIYDEQGNFIPGGDVVDKSTVKIYDPNDKIVSISDVTWDPDFDFLGGNFNIANGCYGFWDPNDAWVINGYYGKILEPLLIGDYEIELKTNDGQTHTKTYTFAQKIELPYIKSRSFQIHPDSFGNIYFSWDIPEKLLQIAQTTTLTYRPYIAANKNDITKALLWPTIPIHMNSVFIPFDIVQWIAGKGDSFIFAVQVRTDANDNRNNNRSYSKGVPVSDLATTVTKKKQVVVIPIN